MSLKASKLFKLVGCGEQAIYGTRLAILLWMASAIHEGKTLNTAHIFSYGSCAGSIGHQVELPIDLWIAEANDLLEARDD